MSDPRSNPPDLPQEAPQQQTSKGPNLVLLYSLIVLALVVAIALACTIVFPFYVRR